MPDNPGRDAAPGTRVAAAVTRESAPVTSGAASVNRHVALVTGANHGIGAATAMALAAGGCAVLCTYLRHGGDASSADPSLPGEYHEQRRADGQDVVAAIRAGGGEAWGVEADLCDPAAPAMLFDTAEQRLGPVDVLVNNASGWVQDTFAAGGVDHLGRGMSPVSTRTWSRQFLVDARAPALLIGEFARRHRERGARWGRIIGLVSGGEDGFPEEVSYGAAKAAQTSYTLSAAVELADLGITANLVHPPITDTGWISDAVREFVATSRSHTRVATPAQVAEVIAFLVSDAAGLVSGNVITLR